MKSWAIAFIAILLVAFASSFWGRIYFPGDILNLLPLFHSNSSVIPHNSLISDPLTQFEPWRYFAKQQLLQGRFPLWNDLNTNGQPLFANNISALLFPLNFLYYIFPISIALNLIPLLKIFSLFIFSYLYLKSVKCSQGTSIVGSLAISISGFSIVWLLWPQTNVFMFFPLLLYLTEKLIRAKNEIHRWYILIAISYGLLALGGHPETLVHIFFIHWAYIIFRLKFQLKKFIVIALFIGIGFGLAGIQLLPFIEYLLNSYSLAYRIPDPSLSLPPLSFVLNIFPFILGAPHIGFYKPITNFTNFQESIGGYTGLIVFTVAIFGSFVLFKKNTIVRFWTVSNVILLLLAYNIWPLSFILDLPLLKQTSNGRLMAFVMFGLCVIFTIFIQNREQIFNKYNKTIKFFITGLFLFSIFIITTILSLINFSRNQLFHHPFIPLLTSHISLILFTTLAFFVCFYIFTKHNKRQLILFTLIFFVGVQELAVIGNYAPLIYEKEYYPKTFLIDKIKNLPRGNILEIGNPSLPPNTNLIYNIPLAESYDAIDIKNYKESFNKDFPIRNQWGKIDAVEDVKKLEKYAIAYLLTDYNPNLSLQEVQPKYDKLLDPMIGNKAFEISFVAKYKMLSEIRLLPANYNRRNTCKILISLSDFQSRQNILSENIDCLSLLDKMYFTLELKKIQLVPGKKYILSLISPDGIVGNSVTFWGNAKNEPYLKLFYNNSKKTTYEFIGEEKGVKLWKVPDVSRIVLSGNYKIVYSNPSEIMFEYATPEDTYSEVKIPFYPGWNAFIDGKKTSILNNKPFIGIFLPKGTHIVRLTYMPLSFLIGSLLSLISAIFIIIYLLKKEMKQPWVKKFSQSFAEWAKKNKKTPWQEHAGIIILGSIIAVSVYLSLIHILKPQFFMPWTTAINWYTVHSYPRQQDYFYFITAFVTITLATIIIWILWIWRKDK